LGRDDKVSVAFQVTEATQQGPKAHHFLILYGTTKKSCPDTKHQFFYSLESKFPVMTFWAILSPLRDFLGVFREL
jgi:hypothetical protein